MAQRRDRKRSWPSRLPHRRGRQSRRPGRDLRDELRVQGGTRVPVVVALSEDFYEVARLGDRTLSAYRRKARNELGPACDSGLVPPNEDELAAEVQEWIDFFERAQLIVRLSPMLRERHND